MNYESSGVSVQRGDLLVEWLKSRVAANHAAAKSDVSLGVGPYASVLSLGGIQLALTCDGVGTKTKMVIDYCPDQIPGLGQDLLAMNANDLVCVGATPEVFLDYYACGHLDLDRAKAVLGGLIDACTDLGIAVVGGETAEMPGVYQPNDIDLAGFCVGRVLGKAFQKVQQPGIWLVGLPSTGPHANGFSLIRQIHASRPLPPEMLEWACQPTALYVKPVISCWQSGLTQACAHITGGGIDNLSRILGPGIGADLQWKVPEQFSCLVDWGQVQDAFKTWNMGMGMIIATPDPDGVTEATGGVVLGQTNTSGQVRVVF